MTKEYVYFITYENGPIKIGKARSVPNRLSALQTASAEKLFVIGVMGGGGPKERELHETFAHLRIRGEWFRPDASLMHFIQANRDTSLFFDQKTVGDWDPLEQDDDCFGPVAGLHGTEYEGRVGFWDDNDEEDLVERCSFCVEAELRKIEVEDCDKCIYEKFAIVYFDEWSKGYEHVPHEYLRRIDEDLEPALAQRIMSTVFTAYSPEERERVLSTGDSAAPIYDNIAWRDQAKRALQEHYSKNVFAQDGGAR
jgi:hypothetical protein